MSKLHVLEDTIIVKMEEREFSNLNTEANSQMTLQWLHEDVKDAEESVVSYARFQGDQSKLTWQPAMSVVNIITDSPDINTTVSALHVT